MLEKLIHRLVEQTLEELGDAQKQIQVYVDMDGVLADFDGAIRNNPKIIQAEKILDDLLQQSPDLAVLHKDDLKSALGGPQEDPLRKKIKKAFNNYREISYGIAGKPGHFINLDELPGARSMLVEIKVITGKLPHILTAPMESNKTCEEEKHIWINKHFSNLFDEFYCTQNKHDFARSKFDILIDDRPKYVDKFRSAGGTAILHTDSANSVEQLKRIVEELTSLNEVTAISTGGGTLQPSGQISGTGGNPLGRDMTDQYETMWSGDKPKNKKKLKEVRRPEYKPGKGLKFTRYGGLTPRKQKNKSAPTKRGLWAFVYPYFDWWFLSGKFSHIEGRFKKNYPEQSSKVKDVINNNLLKHFFYDGPIYTKINVPGSVEQDNWYLTTTKELSDYLPKVFSQDTALSREIFTKDLNDKKVSDIDHEKDAAVKRSPYKYGHISTDHYEVFIPSKRSLKNKEKIDEQVKVGYGRPEYNWAHAEMDKFSPEHMEMYKKLIGKWKEDGKNLAFDPHGWVVDDGLAKGSWMPTNNVKTIILRLDPKKKNILVLTNLMDPRIAIALSSTMKEAPWIIEGYTVSVITRNHEEKLVGKVEDVLNKIKTTKIKSKKYARSDDEPTFEEFEYAILEDLTDKKWYHATKLSNLNSIKTKGLLKSGDIGQGSGWTQFNLDIQNAVYLTADEDYALGIAETLADRYGEPAVILEVSGDALNDKTKLVLDEDSIRDSYEGMIAPGHIKVGMPDFMTSVVDKIQSIGFEGVIPPNLIAPKYVVEIEQPEQTDEEDEWLHDEAETNVYSWEEWNRK